MDIEKFKKDIIHHLNYVPEMSQTTYIALKGAFDIINAIEDIKAEIQKALDEDKATDTENAKVQAIALMWCLEIIDKHIEGV